MKCIFCKNDSSKSISVEHIIPESLGNKKNTLSKGVVCDSCNNYFGSKIEKTVLELPYFKSLRSRLLIANKKRKNSRMLGLTENGHSIEIGYSMSGNNTFEVVCNDNKTLDSLKKSNKLFVPFIPKPPLNNLHISKFIGKIAIEALAQRISSAVNWQSEFVENKGLDVLPNYVRYGKGNTIWPYHVRRICDELQIVYDKKSNKLLQKLNEYDFLIPDNPAIERGFYYINNLYFIMNILGIEYSVNITDKGLTRYITWLSDNKNKSILQMEKSKFNSI